MKVYILFDMSQDENEFQTFKAYKNLDDVKKLRESIGDKKAHFEIREIDLNPREKENVSSII